MADNTQRDQFIAALVDMIVAGAASETNPGLLTVEKLRDSAFARIGRGNGQIVTLVQGMLNGKQGQLAVNMSCLEVFNACAEALRNYNDGQSCTTVASFLLFQR